MTAKNMGQESDLDVYRSDLIKLNDWAMSCKNIGSNQVFEVLRTEVDRANAIRHNAYTTEQGIDGWIHNFAYNLPKMPKATVDWRKLYPIEHSAIVVGGGPSITDSQLQALKGYRGTILSVNKSLGRLYDAGVVPDWALMVHTTDEILPNFAKESVRKNLWRTKVLMSSLSHPSVTDEVLAHADPDRLFWYNPSIPGCFAPMVDKMVAALSNQIVVDTGGNVGIWGLVVAHLLGAKEVGLLGMEHCVDASKPNGWSNVQAAMYDYKWAPEDNQFYCITPLFKAYLRGLIDFINRISNQTTVVNLTPFGPMYSQRNHDDGESHGIPYQSVEEFVLYHD